MSWEAIGAIGEVLGATAVIATLVYLAVQVRHLKSELHMSTLKDQADIFAGTTTAVATSPALATVLEKAKNDVSIEPWERRMVDNYFITWMNAFELLYNQERANTLEIQDLDTNGVLNTFFSTESWATHSWQRNRGFWPQSFQMMVDREIQKLGMPLVEGEDNAA